MMLTVAQQVSVATTIYESWPNTVLITQALMSYSIGIQVRMKLRRAARFFNFFSVHQSATRLLNYFLRPTLANDIFLKFETLYKANESIDDSRRDLLRTKIKRCRFLVKLFLYSNFIALHAPIIAALANVFLAGIMDLPLLSYIPLVDRTTLVGFGSNYFLQFLTLTFSFLGFSTYDASVIFFSFQTVPIVGLLKFKVRELQNLMQTSGQAFEANRKRFREMLAEIVELHLTYNELIKKIGEFCLIPTFVGIYVNTLGLCACMVAMTQLSSGSSIILQLFLQIFIPCVMGEVITTQVRIVELLGTPPQLISAH